MNTGGQAVLVVDDEEEMCWVLEHVLTRHGYACETARGGQEAHAALGRRAFQIALLDAKMPDIDGLELARQIRGVDPELPIILISGYFYQDNTTIQQAIASGLIDAFFSKPFDHGEILAAIGRHRRRVGRGHPRTGNAVP